MTIDSASEMIVCMLLNLVHWRLVVLRSILCHPKVVEFKMGLLVASMFMYEEAWLLFLMNYNLLHCEKHLIGFTFG